MERIKNIVLTLGIMCMLAVSALAYPMPTFHYIVNNSDNTEKFYVSDNKWTNDAPNSVSFWVKREFVTPTSVDGVSNVGFIIYAETYHCSNGTRDVLTAEYFDATTSTSTAAIIKGISNISNIVTGTAVTIAQLIQQDVCK